MSLLNKNSRGFSLIELIVVTTILITLTSLSIANFRSGEKRKAVRIASDTVINSIRNAQNWALTGRKTTNTNVNCRNPQSYYVSILHQGQFSVYALNNCGTSDLMETVKLPYRTQVKSGGLQMTTASSTITASNYTQIYFALPYGEITGRVDTGSIQPFLNMSVVVESTDGSASKTVTIDGISGRIGD